MVGAISQEFQGLPHRFFNARNLLTRSARMLTSLLYILHCKISLIIYFLKEIQQMQFLVERFVPLSSQLKITLVSISKKAFKFKRIGFFSNLTDGIDHLIQKIIFMSYLVSSRKLKFELLVAFVIN